VGDEYREWHKQSFVVTAISCATSFVLKALHLKQHNVDSQATHTPEIVNMPSICNDGKQS